MTDFNNELLAFLGASPTPFHACAQMATRLEAAGFQRLHEQNAWNLAPGRYYVLRNDSSLIAFVRGTVDPAVGGIRMVGAHTDSPCLRLKPKPEAISHGYLTLGVEVYGGVLLNPLIDALRLYGPSFHSSADVPESLTSSRAIVVVELCGIRIEGHRGLRRPMR